MRIGRTFFGVRLIYLRFKRAARTVSNEFLAELTTTVAGIEQRARELFGALDAAQLNWTPWEDAWSVGQCLDHLVKANDPYFAIFRDVAAGTHTKTFWEQIPIVPGICGSLVLNTVRPENTRKARAPRIFQPGRSAVPTDVVDHFCAQQRKLAEAMASLDGIDLDNTIVTSPVARFITYSLRHALSIVVEHEKRHMNQAERVLRALGA